MKSPESGTSPTADVDPHIAHEDLSNRPLSPGGVPDEADVGKTAPPDEQWNDVGTNYGGLRERPASDEHDATKPDTPAPKP